MKKPRMTKTMLFIRSDVKALFKAYCAERGRTMTEVLDEMICERLKFRRRSKRDEI